MHTCQTSQLTVNYELHASMYGIKTLISDNPLPVQKNLQSFQYILPPAMGRPL